MYLRKMELKKFKWVIQLINYEYIGTYNNKQL